MIEDNLAGEPLRSEYEDVVRFGLTNPKVLNYLLYQIMNGKQLKVHSKDHFDIIMNDLLLKREELSEKLEDLYQIYSDNSENDSIADKIKIIDKDILKIKALVEYCSFDEYPCYKETEKFE